MRLIWLALLALCPFASLAQVLPVCTTASAVGAPVPPNETRLAWTRALYSDGGSLGGTETYVIGSRAGSTGAFTDRCTTNLAAAQMLAQPTGRNEYVVRTRFTGFTDSANAGPVFKVNGPVRTLSPPTNFVVSPDNLVAYGSQQSDEVQRTFPVGTVAAGASCDGTMSANGLYRVPKSSVTWAGSVRPAVVFAECAPSGG